MKMSILTAKMAQGKQNAKQYSPFFHCHAAAYLCFFDAKII